MLQRRVGAVLQDDLRKELQDLLDRISQDMFHSEEKVPVSSSSSSSSFSATFLDPTLVTMYQQQAEQQSLAEIKVDHVTRDQSAFLNQCAEELCASGPFLHEKLCLLDEEVKELSNLQQHVSNMMEHWDMIAPFWVGDELVT